MKLRISMVLCFLLVLNIYAGCKKSDIKHADKEPALMEIPAGFDAMKIPDDNIFSMDRWQLGKRLFYSNALSLNNTLSCSSCHHQEFAFSDSLAFSPGDAGAKGTSNAPTLTNVGYQPYYLRGGSVPTLEMQVLVPIQEHNEFNTNIVIIAKKLKQDSIYNAMSRKAYNREMDYYVITRAIACFERSLISGNNRYDQYAFQNKKNVLTTAELNGMQLFFSEKTNCSHCHSGFNFTNYSFENNGLYLNYTDSGRMRFTKAEIDRDKFKVPTLRNIAFSAPYMHDGSIKTLEMVVEHYDSGGVNHPNKSMLLKPLHLSVQEKQDLIAFLKTLSDDNFIEDKRFKNE